jgi:hypothetical protein
MDLYDNNTCLNFFKQKPSPLQPGAALVSFRDSLLMKEERGSMDLKLAHFDLISHPLFILGSDD